MRAMVLRACVLGSAMMLTAACGDEGEGPSFVEEDAGDPASACPPNIQAFATGAMGLSVTRPELNLMARVEAASHQPPRFGTNDWTIAITDMNGQALPQAQLIWACAYMPAHGHGSNPRLVEKLDATLWRLERQNMSMQGLWEIQLWIDADGGNKEFTGGQGGRNSTSCIGPQSAPPTLSLSTCVPRRNDAS